MQMETKDLEEYLGIVVDLEKNIYMQKQLIKSLWEKISSLGIPKHFAEPVQPAKPKVLSPFFYLLAAVGALAAAFVCCIPVAIFDSMVTLGITDWVFIIAAGIIFLYLAIEIHSGNSSKTKKYSKAIEKYEQDLEKYRSLLRQDKKRLSQEERQKLILKENLEQMEQCNKNSIQTLADVYALDIIYEKYRTFPQVCSLYEYIRSGRCTSLREEKGFGSGGAYNLLEQEALQKTIILQLNQILQQLDAIQENQYMLYSAIQENNRKMNEILAGISHLSGRMHGLNNQQVVSCLKQMERNSAITAYNAERIEKELSYMNRMNFYARKYDDAGMFRNRSPV